MSFPYSKVIYEILSPVLKRIVVKIIGSKKYVIDPTSLLNVTGNAIE